MKQHELTQGSAEWLAYRKEHFNASDAPAMMGCSAYKTRSQLLQEMHTGLTPEVDAATQRRFDEGHRFEALARPLAEKIIGEDLFPVVGSLDEYSASFDGLTMLEDTAFEHKTLNDELRAAFADMQTIAPEFRESASGCSLPLQYKVQMEQQLMVSGAGRVLFMASKWEGDTLIEELHCWYVADLALRAKIGQGWIQFKKDLAAYAPSAVDAEVIGHTPETLPALRIEVTGMVTASNLEAYKSHALAVFTGINRELKTDQQFADAEKVVKWCGDVEARLAAAKQHALSQTESIDALFRAIDDISAEAKRTRLELDKLVKARKEAVRGEIVAGGIAALREHVAALNARLGKPYMPTVSADFAGAIKGKRTIDSLNDAVDTLLANTKIEASATADRIQANLATLRELGKDHVFLFSDTVQIVMKAPDDLTMLVKSRIAEHQQKEAARIEAETARIKAEVEQQARVKAEQAVAAQKVIEDAAAAMALAATQAAMTDQVATGTGITKITAVLDGADDAPVMLVEHVPAANVVRLPTPQESAARILSAYLPEVQKTPPTLKLGQIGERLGFSLTGDFLKNIGFEPAARDKSALLFHEADFPLICMRLVSHIQQVQAKRAA